MEGHDLYGNRSNPEEQIKLWSSFWWITLPRFPGKASDPPSLRRAGIRWSRPTLHEVSSPSEPARGEGGVERGDRAPDKQDPPWDPPGTAPQPWAPQNRRGAQCPGSGERGRGCSNDNQVTGGREKAQECGGGSCGPRLAQPLDGPIK